MITRSIVDQGPFELVDIANAEVLETIEEFDIAVNDAISSVAFVTAVFPAVREQFRELAAAIRNQTGANDPPFNMTTSDESVGFYARWTLSEILDKVRDDGLVGTQLGAQLIVFLYTLWEDDFRKKFADAHGCRKEDLQVDVFGDLRLMRNDIIHHWSVASSDNTGRCQVLRWFKQGEVIRPGARHYFELVVERFPWEILATGPNASSRQPELTGDDDARS